MIRPSKTGFSGIYPMMLSFFSADDRIDCEAMRRQVEAVVRHGAHGVAVLGLGTEVNKLSLAERHEVLAVVSESLSSRLPLSVTVAENTVAGQLEFARAAVDAGADWLILQPPPVKDVAEIELQRFFGRVADGVDVPIGIQNAPMYLGVGLSTAGLCALQRQHPNVRILKVEDAPLTIATLAEETEGKFDIFAGRAGLELPDLMAAGCVGCIPGVEVCDRLVRAFDLIAKDQWQQARAIYQEVESVVVFLEQSINHFVTYSRELTSRRLGLKHVEHRLGKDVSPFGVSILDTYHDRLGSL